MSIEKDVTVKGVRQRKKRIVSGVMLRGKKMEQRAGLKSMQTAIPKGLLEN